VRNHVDPRAGKITYEKWSAQFLAGALHKRPTTLARDKIVNDEHFIPAIGNARSRVSPCSTSDASSRDSPSTSPATVRTDHGGDAIGDHPTVGVESLSLSGLMIGRRRRLPRQSRAHQDERRRGIGGA